MSPSSRCPCTRLAVTNPAASGPRYERIWPDRRRFGIIANRLFALLQESVSLAIAATAIPFTSTTVSPVCSVLA